MHTLCINFHVFSVKELYRPQSTCKNITTKGKINEDQDICTLRKLQLQHCMNFDFPLKLNEEINNVKMTSKSMKLTL